MTVAFTLAFARNEHALRCGFFLCQQHNPQNFWNPAFQQHANGAKTIAGLTMVAPKPHEHSSFMRLFAGGGVSSTTDDSLGFILPRGRMEILSQSATERAYGLEGVKPGFLGFSIAVPNVHEMRARLVAAKVRHYEYEGRVIISPRNAFGSMIAFERG
jgi:hypothetical protein